MPDDVEVSKQEVNFTEIGLPGLSHTGGQVTEEFLTELKGTKGIDAFKEMRDNDPIVGAGIMAIQNLVKQAEWHVEPGGDSQRDIEVADFVETNIHDMEDSWKEFITEAMSMIVFGWSLHEVVYKRREGNILDPVRGSKYDDGRIGWQDLAPRGQDTLFNWEFDDNERVQAFVQAPNSRFSRRSIPRRKFLLFRATTHKSNPEGKSALRNAYRPWFFKKRIEELEGIGIERDLAGLPVVKVPPRLLKSSATDTEKETLDRIRDMVKNVRNDEQAGLILPAAYDDRGNSLMEFDLLTTRGRKKFDTTEIIERYNKTIAMSMLADFILIGHESVGSFALASSKTNLFSTAIGSYMGIIADEINKRAIPQLLRFNGMLDAEMPTLVHSDIETVDLDALANYVTALAKAGLDLTGDDVVRRLRDQANLPTESVEESDDEKPNQNSPADIEQEGDENAVEEMSE